MSNMTPNIKIGIIQNAPLTADLSLNLRQIVQGYRECLDHGADIIIATAYSLCGAGLHDLADRTSFLQQTEAALDALSQELGSTPLILGAYAPLPGLFPTDYDDDDEDTTTGTCQHGILVPYLMENDSVTELENGETVDINGVSVYIDVNDEEVVIDDMEPNLIVHLATKSWHANAAKEDEANRQWEANTNGVPVICVRHVGTANGSIYGGGSGIYLPGKKTHARLPFFEPAAQSIALCAAGKAKALPQDEELLAQALERGIRDTVLHNGYVGACIILDEPQSCLLAALCAEALGAANVHGVTFNNNTTCADILNLKVKSINIDNITKELAYTADLAAHDVLSARLKTTVMTTYADQHGLMPLSAITRHDLMMNSFVLYGNTGGYLAPLGNMYEMDTYLLSRYFCEKYAALFGTLKEPAHPEQDRIIHELADNNISAGALLHDYVCPFKEEDIRMVQRRIIASAQKRTQTPAVLYVDKESERKEYPTHHRLND